MEREVPIYKTRVDNLFDFLVSNRKQMVIDLIDTCEYILENKISTSIVCIIEVSDSSKFKHMIDCILTINEVLTQLDSVMDWILENEEYELANRIKNIKDYIVDNNVSENIDEWNQNLNW